MPCLKHMFHWHQLPAPSKKRLLLLVENKDVANLKWQVTGFWDDEIGQFISSLPSKEPIEQNGLIVTKWAPITILPFVKKRS